LRVHIEVSPDPAGTSQNISVLRSNPVLVTIKREPILTEANIVSAKVIDTRGGFAIEIKFDENGTWLRRTIFRRQSRRSFRHLESMERK